ncbi:MMPL family transporter [Desulfosarcina sp. OttesenSCG-928-G10]|nr:MMPL family transporter [Desulfosarcina sp. OttesenSCG-928-G10]MDL2321959.1 MMPL family transporter [Desulfosarcina sp. OttesenSCG-928-B08]
MTTRSNINFPLLAAVILTSLILFYVGWQRISIDTDVINSLPHDNPVLNNAVHIFRNHPMQDQVTIDVGIDRTDPDQLVTCGLAVMDRLEKSGLFKTVGTTAIQDQLPRLVEHIVDSLPVLFTPAMLETQVVPKLSPDQIDAAIYRWHQNLLQMDAIGQSGYISRDPLSLKDILLARLIFLAPSTQARVVKGQIVSMDGRHLLLSATPTGSATDTAFARKIARTLDAISDDIQKTFAPHGITVTLTPVGAYRAALDNEVIIRKDVQSAIVFSTIGIVILLLLAFPRPLIGLFSLLPAIVGTLLAFFVWSLFCRSISIMVLGFGGAIISITVDHGIAYLLFLDQNRKTDGKNASEEVWAVGLLATLTTVGAFSALCLSQFSIFRELGLFAALGISFSFLFVHLIFPRIFPSMEPAKPRWLPIPRLADGLFGMGTKGLAIAVIIAGVMVFFARPGFNANMETLNTVSRESLAAEKHFLTVWGNIFTKVFFLAEAETPEALQAKGDALLSRMEKEPGLLDQMFLPAMIFPGPERRAENLAAWKAFWTPDRRAAVRQAIDHAGSRYGFTDAAFSRFVRAMDDPETLPAVTGDTAISEDFFSLMGISAHASTPRYRQFTSFVPPAGFSGTDFFSQYQDQITIFDPALFSSQLGDVMASTFSRLIVTIGPMIVIFLLIFFASFRLTLIALSPVCFSMACTLGTLTLMGRSLDIPGLMLAIIIFGLGIDYSLFLVRAYQRYGKAGAPEFSLIRSTVVMSSASSLVGFGVLAFADHSLLQSAGITCVMGIGYAAVGAFLILPPLMGRYVEHRRPLGPGADVGARVRWRYGAMTPYVRFFAQFKLKLDPMFSQLEQLMQFTSRPERLMDIGSGFGVPACWMAEQFPGVRVFGIEPDHDRARTANRALSGSGAVIQGAAPGLPEVPTLPEAPALVDGALMLDMIHYLSPDDVSLTLSRLHRAIRPGGLLIIRSVTLPARKNPWSWRIAALRDRFKGLSTTWRSPEALREILIEHGFEVLQIFPSDRHGELVWLHCRVLPEPPSQVS